jgi:hypothetical protein
VIGPREMRRPLAEGAGFASAVEQDSFAVIAPRA